MAKKQPKHIKPPEPGEIKEPINLKVYLIVLFVILIVAIGFISWDRLTVRDIEIEGIVKINYLEVVRLSDIEYMTNIFSIKPDDVKKNIEQNPNLKVLDVRRKLPDTIIIEIEEREPIATIKCVDKKIGINENCIALEVFESLAQSSRIEIIGTSITKYELGYEAEFEKDIHKNKLTTLLNSIKTTGIQEHIKTIDISFTENIKLYSIEGYEIHIGNVQNIDNKCIWIKTMIPKLIEEGKQGGILYITNVDSAHYIGAENEENP